MKIKTNILKFILLTLIIEHCSNDCSDSLKEHANDCSDSLKEHAVVNIYLISLLKKDLLMPDLYKKNLYFDVVKLLQTESLLPDNLIDYNDEYYDISKDKNMFMFEVKVQTIYNLNGYVRKDYGIIKENKDKRLYTIFARKYSSQIEQIKEREKIDCWLTQIIEEKLNKELLA